MTSVRLPDLWLKIEMALAIVPPGTPMSYVRNDTFAQCVRGDDGRASTFNQWMAGDNPLRLADDIYFLAATLECLVSDGIKASSNNSSRRWDRNVVQSYADSLSHLSLEKPLTGTFGDFGAALLNLVGKRSDYQDLGGSQHFESLLDGVVRRGLLNTIPAHADLSGDLDVIHGPSRHWRERLARQRPRGANTVPEHDFIQFAVPPSPSERLIFGFELRTDTNLAAARWDEVGGWFMPQLQKLDKPALVLEELPDDADAFRAEVLGEFRVQVVSIDATTSDARLPHGLSKLTDNAPDWPEGYGESMALITYVKRRARDTIKAKNENLRELNYSPAVLPEMLTLVPPRVRFYRNDYRVVERGV